MIGLSKLADAVLSTLSDAIVAADKDGIIRFWNPGAERRISRQPVASWKRLCCFLRIERSGRGNCPHVTVGAEALPEAQDGAGGGGDAAAASVLTLSDERAAATSFVSEEEVLREFYVPLSASS